MTPDQLRQIPTRLLQGYRNIAELEEFLAERNLPRPTLAEIIAERKRRYVARDWSK